MLRASINHQVGGGLALGKVVSQKQNLRHSLNLLLYPSHPPPAPRHPAGVPLHMEPLAEDSGPIVSSNPGLQNPLEHFIKFLYTPEKMTPWHGQWFLM